MIEVVSRQPLPADLAVAKVKEFVRVYDAEHDATLTLLTEAAIEFIQTYTRQTFRQTVYRQTTDDAALPFRLERLPVQSISQLEYQDDQYVWHTIAELAEFEVDNRQTPPSFKLKDNSTFSLPTRRRFAVDYLAGITDWPKDLVLLVLQMVEENFDRRGTTPATAQAVRFSRSHELALEQYSLHFDAVTWA